MIKSQHIIGLVGMVLLYVACSKVSRNDLYANWRLTGGTQIITTTVDGDSIRWRTVYWYTSASVYYRSDTVTTAYDVNFNYDYLGWLLLDKKTKTGIWEYSYDGSNQTTTGPWKLNKGEGDEQLLELDIETGFDLSDDGVWRPDLKGSFVITYDEVQYLWLKQNIVFDDYEIDAVLKFQKTE